MQRSRKWVRGTPTGTQKMLRRTPSRIPLQNTLVAFSEMTIIKTKCRNKLESNLRIALTEKIKADFSEITQKIQ